MAGVKGKSGRYKKYPNETPEEEKRVKARNRIYQESITDARIGTEQWSWKLVKENSNKRLRRNE